MGNASSTSRVSEENDDLWWTNGQNSSETIQETLQGDEERPPRIMSAENVQKLNEFRLEFARKHEKRRQILADKKKEMMDLREGISRLRKENEELKKGGSNGLQCDPDVEYLKRENERLKESLDQKNKLLEKSTALTEKNKELRISITEMQGELQNLNTEVLDFEKERQDYRAHVVALKDVITVSKQMLSIRENQLRELKQKVDSIESSLEGREMNILSQDLRSEYERQLQNIRNLRALYEERQQVDRRQNEQVQEVLSEVRKELENEKKKSSEFEERIAQLEEENSKKYDEIKSLDSNLGLAKAESRQYQAELTVINQLFSEVLLGFQATQDIDLDELAKHLEDHHELLQNIVVNEISSEVSSALPKVLLDLVNQVNDKKKEEEEDTQQSDGIFESAGTKLETIIEESESQTSTVQQMNSAEEIAGLMPKVWKVLIELLSHQKAPTNELTGEDNENDPCYKTVQTSKGPSLVLSVSQTFIRLKDLILEKKSLEKEMHHLKHLNGHLENRLQDQEKRLEMVSAELSKTWHVVGKLQKQHQLLHTQEKILKYELAQKRKLLNQLKEELEYSREKWQQAREKNSNTEEQWKQLRTEFASRRNTVTDDFNNSVESGYSDERSSDDEPGYETDASENNTKQTEEATACEENISEDKSQAEESDQMDQPQGETSCIEELIQEITTNVLNEEAIHTEEAAEETPANERTAKEISNEDERRRQEEATYLEASTSNEEKTQVNVAGDKAKTEDTSEEKTDAAAGSSKPKKTLEEVLAARDERFRRLEGQAERLVQQVTDTNNRSVMISNKLDTLHETYREGAPRREDDDQE